MMGFFDEMTKAVGSQLLSGGGQKGAMDQVLGLINNPEVGGLGGLVQLFNSKGLGDIMSSWIGTGENLPVSGDQIAHALGSEKIREIAEKLGMSGADTSNNLAALLPKIIDGLTPDGTVPQGGLLEQGLCLLKQKFSV
jgi:uncharacterized protein YidB (DUF937 family)